MSLPIPSSNRPPLELQTALIRPLPHSITGNLTGVSVQRSHSARADYQVIRRQNAHGFAVIGGYINPWGHGLARFKESRYALKSARRGDGSQPGFDWPDFGLDEHPQKASLEERILKIANSSYLPFSQRRKILAQLVLRPRNYSPRILGNVNIDLLEVLEVIFRGIEKGTHTKDDVRHVVRRHDYRDVNLIAQRDELQAYQRAVDVYTLQSVPLEDAERIERLLAQSHISYYAKTTILKDIFGEWITTPFDQFSVAEVESWQNRMTRYNRQILLIYDQLVNHPFFTDCDVVSLISYRNRFDKPGSLELLESQMRDYLQFLDVFRELDLSTAQIKGLNQIIQADHIEFRLKLKLFAAVCPEEQIEPSINDDMLKRIGRVLLRRRYPQKELARVAASVLTDQSSDLSFDLSELGIDIRHGQDLKFWPSFKVRFIDLSPDFKFYVGQLTKRQMETLFALEASFGRPQQCRVIQTVLQNIYHMQQHQVIPDQTRYVGKMLDAIADYCQLRGYSNTQDLRHDPLLGRNFGKQKKGQRFVFGSICSPRRRDLSDALVTHREISQFLNKIKSHL